MSLTHKISRHSFKSDEELEEEDSETVETEPESAEESPETYEDEPQETSEDETFEEETPEEETFEEDSDNLDELRDRVDSKVSRNEFEDETDKIWERVVKLEDEVVTEEEIRDFTGNGEVSREEFDDLREDVEELSELVLKLIDDVDETLDR